jgi:tRNA(fMet)-specific endonuclease VapC
MALISADTTFLIDLSRESGRNSGPVHDFLRRHLQDEFSLSVTTLGEFAAGFADTADETFMAVKAHFKLRPMDDSDAWHYRRTFHFLKEWGELIGANDLWIADSALKHGEPLVTRNVREFQRVSGLQVLTY